MNYDELDEFEDLDDELPEFDTYDDDKYFAENTNWYVQYDDDGGYNDDDEDVPELSPPPVDNICSICDGCGEFPEDHLCKSCNGRGHIGE